MHVCVCVRWFGLISLNLLQSVHSAPLKIFVSSPNPLHRRCIDLALKSPTLYIIIISIFCLALMISEFSGVTSAHHRPIRCAGTIWVVTFTTTLIFQDILHPASLMQRDIGHADCPCKCTCVTVCDCDCDCVFVCLCVWLAV